MKTIQQLQQQIWWEQETTYIIQETTAQKKKGFYPIWFSIFKKIFILHYKTDTILFWVDQCSTC